MRARSAAACAASRCCSILLARVTMSDFVELSSCSILRVELSRPGGGRRRPRTDASAPSDFCFSSVLGLDAELLVEHASAGRSSCCRSRPRPRCTWRASRAPARSWRRSRGGRWCRRPCRAARRARRAACAASTPASRADAMPCSAESDLALAVGDRVLRLQVLLVEHVGAVAVRLDLRVEPLGLRGLGGEVALRCRARGHREGRRRRGPDRARGPARRCRAPRSPATAVGLALRRDMGDRC